MQKLAQNSPHFDSDPDLLIITVDGLSGSGKSTAIEKVCEVLPLLSPISIGAVGRAAVFFARKILNIDISNPKISEQQLNHVLSTARDWNLEDPNLRSYEISTAVPKAQHLLFRPSYLEFLKSFMRSYVKEQKSLGMIIDGRIAHRLFPEALCKFWFEADLEVRAKRLSIEQNVPVDNILSGPLLLEYKDTIPLFGIDYDHTDLYHLGIIPIDTTNLKPDEVVRSMASSIRQKWSHTPEISTSLGINL